jgi:2-C-methyl-D-erythritol 2,4-cyclodiphosphate synthase
VIRVGQGVDIHAFAPGRPLILGGVHIPHDRGLDGHSDADALLHAVTSAVLGAAGLGDLGDHFPSSDERWRNADSRSLLRHAVGLASQRGWRIGNVDSTVVAQAPRLSPYKAAMAGNIAAACRVPVDQVNVKAATTDRLGFLGREEGIAAFATVLLERVPS